MRDIITAVIRASDPDIMIREPETIELACAKMIDMTARLEGDSSPAPAAAPAPAGKIKNRSERYIKELDVITEERARVKMDGLKWLSVWDENKDRALEAFTAGRPIMGQIVKDKQGREKMVDVEVVR